MSISYRSGARSQQSKGLDLETSSFNQAALNPIVGANRDGVYSGAIHQGFEPDGSFDRMLFHDLNRVRSIKETEDLLRFLRGEFEHCDRSRLVARVICQHTDGNIAKIARVFRSGEVSGYPDSEGRFTYLTYSENKPIRALPVSVCRALQKEVAVRASDTLMKMGDYESFSVAELQRVRRAGFTLELSPQAAELEQVWRPFNWRLCDCQHLIDCPGLDRVLALRSPSGVLVAAVLYNDQSHEITQGAGDFCRHGESTEWATLPEYRHHGLIVPLLISMHCLLLEQGVCNVWADLRVPSIGRALPHSVSPALKAGMDLFIEPDLCFLSTNHVTISGDIDIYNSGRGCISDRVNGEQLRCFVKGFLDNRKFTKRLRDTFDELLMEQ